MCLQLSLGVAALFGPHSGAISRHVDCISSRLEIPHVITAVEWSSAPSDGLGRWRDDRLFTVNVHPAGRQISRVYVDLIRLFHWNNFCVVFANSYGNYRAFTVVTGRFRAFFLFCVLLHWLWWCGGATSRSSDCVRAYRLQVRLPVGHYCVPTLVKLFAPLFLCRQTVGL